MLQNMRGHDHVINSKVIDSGSHRTSKTLESWHTAVTNNAENNSVTSQAIYDSHKEKHMVFLQRHNSITCMHICNCCIRLIYNPNKGISSLFPSNFL